MRRGKGGNKKKKNKKKRKYLRKDEDGRYGRERGKEEKETRRGE
jgi:hypothetical protein